MVSSDRALWSNVKGKNRTNGQPVSILMWLFSTGSLKGKKTTSSTVRAAEFRKIKALYEARLRSQSSRVAGDDCIGEEQPVLFAAPKFIEAMWFYPDLFQGVTPHIS